MPALRALFARFRRPAPSLPAEGAGLTRRDLGALAAAGALMPALPAAAAAPASGFAGLDRATLETLVRGLADLNTAADPSLAAHCATTLARIAEVLPSAEPLYRLHAHFRGGGGGAVWRRPPRVDMALLEAACLEARPLAIRYTDLKGATTEREVWPLTLVYPDHGIFLLTQCQLRGGFRQFFAHAIDHATVLPGNFAEARPALLDELADFMDGRPQRHA